MRFGCSYPVGPLACWTKIGVDTAYDVLDALAATTGRRHARRMIAAGHLGKGRTRVLHLR